MRAATPMLQRELTGVMLYLGLSVKRFQNSITHLAGV